MQTTYSDKKQDTDAHSRDRGGSERPEENSEWERERRMIRRAEKKANEEE